VNGGERIGNQRSRSGETDQTRLGANANTAIVM